MYSTMGSATRRERGNQSLEQIWTFMSMATTVLSFLKSWSLPFPPFQLVRRQRVERVFRAFKTFQTPRHPIQDYHALWRAPMHPSSDAHFPGLDPRLVFRSSTPSFISQRSDSDDSIRSVPNSSGLGGMAEVEARQVFVGQLTAHPESLHSC